MHGAVALGTLTIFADSREHVADLADLTGQHQPHPPALEASGKLADHAGSTAEHVSIPPAVAGP